MSKKKPEKTKQPGRVKHGEGLNDYLTLGADRSLEKLCRRYAETMLRPPALVTLKLWSAKHSWQAKAAQHDARVASQVAEKAEEAAVEDGWDHVNTLTDFARLSLDKAMEALQGGSLKAETAYELQALLNASVTALKHIELISGRATDRLDRIDVKTFAPEWLAERLKARAPASPPTTATSIDEAGVPADTTRH